MKANQVIALILGLSMIAVGFVTAKGAGNADRTFIEEYRQHRIDYDNGMISKN